MSGRPEHTIKEAIEAFDDEALFKVMLDQLVRTFPSFAEAPPRIKEARDRLVRLAGAAPDLLDALKAAEWGATQEGRPYCACCHNFRPQGHDAACLVEAAIAKAEGSR